MIRCLWSQLDQVVVERDVVIIERDQAMTERDAIVHRVERVV